MTEELLKIKNLKVIYKTDTGIVNAVNNLSLTVNVGETLGLVGETGAGKTTTALSIMRLLPDRIGCVDSGEIVLDDMELFKLTDADMQLLRGNVVSMIFQDPMTSLNPVICVGDQISEVIQLHNPDYNKDQISEEVDEMFRLVGIPPERKVEFPHQFSGGMKQRIVIGIALACQPKLLLADEPTTALDVTIQAQILDMMRELKEKFATSMVLITHDLGVVAELCDRVAIMYAGEIIEIGTLMDVYTGDQHHPYTKGLFGSIPNLGKQERRLHPIDGLMPDPTQLPDGCKFFERCPYRMDKCEKSQPYLLNFDTHSIRCFLYE
jgi:peptide/nickel transport system ATP-binding protein